jgi:hypothetical protein
LASASSAMRKWWCWPVDAGAAVAHVGQVAERSGAPRQRPCPALPFKSS